MTAGAMTIEDRWVLQGFLMAIADLARRGHLVPASDMLASHGLGMAHIQAASLQPYDVRELLKALAVQRPVVPSITVIEGDRP